MSRKCVHAIFVVLCLNMAMVVAFAQDFHQSYLLAEGNGVSIKNIAGNITVKGYDGAEIIVTAFKEGRDRDQLSIEDFSTESQIDIQVKAPPDCYCEATVRFEISVPQAVSYDYNSFSTAAGNIRIEDLRGKIHADNVSGWILMRNVAGAMFASSFSGDVMIDQATETATTLGENSQPRDSILAKSISGNIKVTLIQLNDSAMNRMEFSSLSGNVEVRVPENLGADVEITTMIGRLITDFPLMIAAPPFWFGGSARGRVGNGAHELIITSVVGNVSLLKN